MSVVTSSGAVRIQVSGARGPRGLASGPLGDGSVGADEISSDSGEQAAIVAKIGAVAPTDLSSTASAKGAGLSGFSHSATYVAPSVGRKLQQIISPMDAPYSAVGDGTADDTTALNNAIAAAPFAGTVTLPAGKKFKTTGLVNDRGIRFVGGGQILNNPGAGIFQLNDYARSMGFILGREYRYRLFSRLNNAGSTLTGFIYGDSTVATSANGGGYAGASGTPDVLLAKQLARSNVRNPISLTNRGAGGTNWSSLNALPDLGAAVDLIVIKYSVNHAGADAAAEITAMRAKLAAIRAATYGAVNLLTIVLVGPNSTYDLAGGRTSAFYELLRLGYEQAARDYKCVYVDVYGMFQDSTWMAGNYMDTPAVHPAALLQMQIWAQVGNALMAPNENQLNVNDDWIAGTFQNSWANKGGGNNNFQVSIEPSGKAFLRGSITRASGTPTGGQSYGVLPNTNYYPALLSGGTAWTYDGTNWRSVPVLISTDGTISPRNADSYNNLVVLDGINWSVRA